jgi:L-fucose isomerase-like protein
MAATFGVIVGNRGFFPDELAEQGRADILKALEAAGFGAVCLTPEDTEFGCVETRQEARKCAELFRQNAGKLDGIVVTLPNFGDERGVADTVRMADLDLPVLVQATPDEPTKGALGQRRDSFCGKISACNNLKQYGIPFSLTSRHTVAVDSAEFRGDLERFAAVCRVVNGMRKARVGAIGARPAAFNTVRFSEKILESHGISVETVDLSDIFAAIEKLGDGEERVTEAVAAIKGYCNTEGVEDQYILKMAKLAVVLREFIEQNELDACAVQCWTSMEENYGIVPCTVMSMLSNSMVPAACEVDVGGALAMYALQLASGTPSALMDWNNNYGDEDDRCVLFHCSNAPKHFFDEVRMTFQDIIAEDVGAENTFGTCVGRVRAGAMSFARLMTDDENGEVMAYVGEGEFTADAMDTFGGYGVVRIPALQRLLRFVCLNGFEHHVAVSLSSCAEVLHEAFVSYLGFTTYHHA